MRRSRQNLRKMGLEREMKFKDRGRNAKVLGQGEGDGFGKGGAVGCSYSLCSLASFFLEPQDRGPRQQCFFFFVPGDMV